jgi:hypothetical protein
MIKFANHWTGVLIGFISFTLVVLAVLFIISVLIFAVWDSLEPWPEDPTEIEAHIQMKKDNTEMFGTILLIAGGAAFMWVGGYIVAHWDMIEEEVKEEIKK